MPVAPGISPSETSGVPNWILRSRVSFSAKRACAASATSQPPPSAAPFSSATTGRPRVSIVRKLFFKASMRAKPSAASSGLSFSTLFNSAPAKNVGFADASITPLMRSLSRTSCAAASARSCCHCSVIVLTGEPGSSKVIVAMPSSLSS
jgi:hypothetical protein